MAKFATLSETNKFAFVCPIFNAEVQIRSCLAVRAKVYKGETLETRRGCQACISSSKCPAAEIQRRISFNISTATDHCASETPVVGKMPADILERIAPVLVQGEHLRRFAVSTSEQTMIESSRERIETQIASAPRSQTAPKRVQVSSSSEGTSVKRGGAVKRSSAPKPASQQPAVNVAAKTGDMAAALNAA